MTEEDLLTAAATGDKDLALRVLDENKAAVFKKNKAGDTPLLLAVENGHTEIIDLLIDRGARLFEASGKGNVFHIAVNRQDKPLLEHLVKLARDDGRLSMMLEYRAVPAGGRQAMTPIGFAALKCDREIYNYLLSVGARPGNRTTTPNMLGYKTPADLMAECKAKPAQAKRLTQKPKTAAKKKTATRKSRR